MFIKRRQFLKAGTLATASLLLPNFLKAMSSPEALERGNKVLVILQLSGGNDGLNTIVPMRNDIYFRERQTIAVDNALTLTDEAGIHPALPFFKTLYDRGELAVLNNVGYPDPNKSHFRSMDIWHSASRSDEYLESGWIGRYLDQACYDCGHPTQALEVNDMLSLALKGKQKKAFAFKDPKKLYQTSREEYFNALYQEHQHQHDEETVAYLYQTLGDTINNADYIFEQSKARKTAAAYPDSVLGKDLKTISSLIKSDINTQVYYLQIGSFDTHINQQQRQESLFHTINDAVEAFVDDLKKNGLFQHVMLMTFSEFGRRVAQNASNGTDHGTANQLFFLSGGLKKQGLLNALPDLTQLNEGDLQYTEDFRKVYATLLKKWLDADSAKILGWKNGIYDFI
ncbi:MAG TPA: twin-arginine translocation pathway signal [Sphingobacterium sp.]|nr:twin-arginine translocation pathway signal [Sphingobacterium sp.]